MENTKLQLKDLSEKNAKALATSATKFLKSNGIAVPHTLALDMAGVLCGFADWQGLRSAIDQAEKEAASKPVKLSYDDFLDTFKPRKNKLADHETADGYGFETYGPELEAVKAAWGKNPDTVWTCVECEGTSYVVNGMHHVNRQFYFITNKPAQAHRFYSIPYGHDEGDQQIEVSVVDRNTGEETPIDTRYGNTVQDILEMIDDLAGDVLDEIKDDGGNPVVVLREVQA